MPVGDGGGPLFWLEGVALVLTDGFQHSREGFTGWCLAEVCRAAPLVGIAHAFATAPEFVFKFLR